MQLEDIKSGVKNFFHRFQKSTDQADGVVEKPIISDGSESDEKLVWENGKQVDEDARRYS